ncbi:MAG: two-component system sensor histidine kinase CreC [Aquabacterium sp.]|uniref:two-component system sensor histidine kinase CreC n=1 Tax=Aquabacterium sp. TaxID=1872578 RepID=UPI0027269C92|nr:two-component system sensor histidine kinase CreC [Aquabacterium sp.]MDO9004804.1 two-component system sensor histidine kinase CreC [Aquabacterium sp.]
MKLGLRLLLGFFLITGIAAFFVMRVFVAEVRPSVSEVMEDMMVDTANILAELAVDDLAALPPGGTLDQSRFALRVKDYAARPVDARIRGLSKQTMDFRIYLTDASGRVVFDTGFRDNVPPATGQDYSQWRDVTRTLRGEYGARSTRLVYSDDQSSVMYVAAPVKQGARIVGVLTVAKPMSTVQQFIHRAERDILVKGFWLLGLSLAIGVAVTGWIVWSVRRLRHYAQHVQLGQRQPPPELPGELGDLAHAMEAMRDRLDGHEHVEQLVRAMTHELKSPLAAIGGAAELLQEELPAADRHLFAQQIRDQADRLHMLVERLLELSKLEHRHSLDHQVVLDLGMCVEQAIQAATARLEQRQLALVWHPLDGLAPVRGEPDLLAMAISNLLENAVDFSSPGGRVEVTMTRSQGHIELSVRDHGPGVPDYALVRLGERFYSTPRPAAPGETPRKGSGLGLAIVRQVMQLHGGSLRLQAAEPGFCATLRLPTSR